MSKKVKPSREVLKSLLQHPVLQSDLLTHMAYYAHVAALRVYMTNMNRYEELSGREWRPRISRIESGTMPHARDRLSEIYMRDEVKIIAEIAIHE